METYQFILKEQNLDVSKVILTGFNTKQNGHDVLKDYGRYKLKKHIVVFICSFINHLYLISKNGGILI